MNHHIISNHPLIIIKGLAHIEETVVTFKLIEVQLYSPREEYRL